MEIIRVRPINKKMFRPNGHLAEFMSEDEDNYSLRPLGNSMPLRYPKFAWEIAPMETPCYELDYCECGSSLEHYHDDFDDVDDFFCSASFRGIKKECGEIHLHVLTTDGAPFGAECIFTEREYIRGGVYRRY